MSDTIKSDAARQQVYSRYIAGPIVETHSAREPAYKWTVLCLVPELRMHPADRERLRQRRGVVWGSDWEEGCQ